jgi:hypothetical protein
MWTMRSDVNNSLSGMSAMQHAGVHKPLDPRLARQSLARPLTEAEQGLARALEAIFVAGTHDFAAVAAALQASNIARPSGTSEPWTTALLETELAAVNAALDAAYAKDGLGA